MSSNAVTGHNYHNHNSTTIFCIYYGSVIITIHSKNSPENISLHIKLNLTFEDHQPHVAYIKFSVYTKVKAYGKRE